MHVKEMPSRVEKLPVVEGTFLGWLGDLPQGPGYACLVITHSHEAASFQAHFMRAPGLDKPWKVMESWADLSSGAAIELLSVHKKLAAWQNER